MDIKDQLIEETRRWLEKIEDERKVIMLKDTTRNDFLENVDAYISDSEFFLEHGEYIEAFEAVIWGWAMLELGLELGILQKKN